MKDVYVCIVFGKKHTNDLYLLYKIDFFGIHAIFHGFWPRTNTNRVILSRAMHF